MSDSIQNVAAVILAGAKDFGRCPLASQAPSPLWPIEGKPALVNLLLHLSQSGVSRAVVCGGQNNEIYRNAIEGKTEMKISFLSEPLPVGTAGCIRDAAQTETADIFLVLVGAMVSPPPVETLIHAHIDNKSDLTVFLNPAENGQAANELAGIYACSKDTIKFISVEGYCDIKEELIPTLWREGKTVKAVTLDKSSGVFRNWNDYLKETFAFLELSNGQTVKVSSLAQVSPNSRICGPVVVMDNAIICDHAIVIGPAVIEKDVVVESGASVRSSILFAGASIGQNSYLNQAVVGFGAKVNENVFFEKGALAAKRNILGHAVEQGAALSSENFYKAGYGMRYIFGRIPVVSQLSRQVGAFSDWIWLILLCGAFLWLYMPEITQLWHIWLSSDEYSGGLLVAPLAAYIIWSRRKEFKRLPRHTAFAGVILLIFSQAFRFFGLFFMYDSARRLSLVIGAASIVIYLFGWQVFRKAIPIFLFLLLMLPIPRSLHNEIAGPLQSWATSSAVFSLEMMGLEVVREGNVIHFGDATVAVAEACNGLRMITAFFVISGLVALLVERTWWEKLIILVSAMPIGLFCNTLRLAFTVIAFRFVQGPWWENVFHDFGGLSMMPIALGIVLAELWVLNLLRSPAAGNLEKVRIG